jgi:3-methyladenine DNA glycosylase AlkD
MTLDEVMRELESKGSASTKRTHQRHGAPEPLFGVKVGDLKVMVKKLKGEQDLALELYATGNSDAMYLAGLIADGSQMTKKQLDQWATGASWHMIAGFTVAWVASEHPKAIDIASKWIDSKKEMVATAGWATLGSVAATVPDENLPVEALSGLLDRCVTSIHAAPNRVKSAMNQFVIAVGTYVAPLADAAMKAARKIGVVQVDMGDTDCKVPLAAEYIEKSRRGGKVAPKRKTAKC